MEEKISTIHLWTERNSITKTDVARKINKSLGVVLDLNSLTLPDLITLEAAMSREYSVDFSSCRSKKDYVAALNTVLPNIKSLHRISLNDLKMLSKAFQ